ncbi:MAG: hypothetical protein PHE67_00140 [Campylobacterales bacterium]|nr:hypothetical protein [Campylobacterales bacterium]
MKKYESDNKLVKKEYGKIYAISTSLDMSKALKDTEIFRFNLHGANVRLRELINEYPQNDIVKISKKVLSTSRIREAIFLVPSANSGYLWGISLYESKSAAEQKLSRTANKESYTELLGLTVYTNMTKAEQRTK